MITEKIALLKNKILFDRISKEVIKKVISQNQQAKDIKIESMILLRSMDVARARAYDVKILLSYERASTSFFLTEDRYLQSTSNKSDLQKKKRIWQVPFKHLKINCRSAVLFDFMAYARKLGSRVTNANLKTFGDFVNNLWQSFLMYSRGCQRIDIVFDNYNGHSVTTVIVLSHENEKDEQQESLLLLLK